MGILVSRERENGMNYVYSTRFQPFNNENMAELDWLLNNVEDKDRIIFGIVNPDPRNTDSRDNPGNWTRFKSCFNPLTYWERYQSIEMLIRVKGCAHMIGGIVPMPRPSVNMDRANNYLPAKSDRRMCVPIILRSELEETKVEGLKNQNEEVFEIPAHEFAAENRIISPELIACLIALNYEDWDKFVPVAIRKFIKSDVNIERRIRDSFNYYYAQKELRSIYNHMPSELKIEMAQSIGDHIDFISSPSGLPTRDSPLILSKGRLI